MLKLLPEVIVQLPDCLVNWQSSFQILAALFDDKDVPWRFLSLGDRQQCRS